MEAAASVAGLLSLSGQILGGLFKLGQHIQDVRELGDRTETVGKETELLVKTVTELESILQRLEGGIAKHPNMTPGVSVLQHQLEQCQNDLKPWIEAHLQATEPRKKRQKVANALLGSSIRAIQKLESKLASHRAQIGLGVGALNTSLSHEGLEKLELVRDDVLRLSDSTLQFNQRSAELSLKHTEESTTRHGMLIKHISTTSEVQIKQSLQMQEETLSHISRLSDSLSSIASFASSWGQAQVHPQFSTGRKKNCFPPILRNRKRRCSSTSSTGELHLERSFVDNKEAEKGWSCGEILGIDQAFVKDADSAHCLFCIKEFREIDSHLQARHIVDCHNFSGCDQAAVFDSLKAFKRHLRAVHAADKVTLANHTQQLRGIFRDYSSIKRDTRLRALSATPPERDSPANLVLLNHQLQTLLSETTYLEDSQDRLYRRNSSLQVPAELRTFRRMGFAVERLCRDVFSDSYATPELARVLHRAAILKEESIVKRNQPFPWRWTKIPDCLLSPASSDLYVSERKGLQGNDQSQYCDPLLHPSRWFVELSFFRPPPTYGVEPKKHHYGVDLSHEGWLWLEEGLRVSALASILSNWTSTRDRINLWMLEVLHKSDHLLAMLRCSAFLGPDEPLGSMGPPANGRARDESQFWGRQWTADLLEVFEKDLNHTVDDKLVEQSVGAVDSRDEEGLIELSMRQARPVPSLTESSDK